MARIPLQDLYDRESDRPDMTVGIHAQIENHLALPGAPKQTHAV